MGERHVAFNGRRQESSSRRRHVKLAWQNWRTSMVWRYGVRDLRQAIQVESPSPAALLENSDAERSGHQEKKELCFITLFRLMISPQSGHCSYLG